MVVLSTPIPWLCRNWHATPFYYRMTGKAQTASGADEGLSLAATLAFMVGRLDGTEELVHGCRIAR
jgi:hypothetical protein